jgi:iron complex outermembrane receptor protein
MIDSGLQRAVKLLKVGDTGLTRGFWLACLILALSGIPLRGDVSAFPSQTTPGALKQMSLEELSQIEVTTPSKEPVKAFQSPVAIYVITGDEIHRSGATSIPEALRLAPGVEVARIDGNKWSIGIRGFGTRFSRGVLVLIDGRTVYSTLQAGTYWEVQNMIMDDIDRIEVIRGPGGTIWGPNAVNGVINVVTKDSKDTQGILASGGGGNLDQGFGNFRYGGGNGSNLTYRAYAMAFTDGPEHHSDHQNFDDWRTVQGGFRVDWNRDDRDSFTFQGDIYKEEAGESVQAVSYTAPYSQIVDANANLSGGNLMARWKKTLRNGDDIQVQTYYDRTTRYEPNFGETRNTFDVDFLERIHPIARQHLTWGLGTRFSLADDNEVVSGLTFLPNKRTDQLYTAFLQDEITLVPDRLSLTAGAKALRTNFTNFGVEPSVRLMWTPTRNNAAWAAFTHALRTPSDAEENFYLSGYIETLPNGTPYFARFNANHNFAPEQLNGYEIGYRRILTSRLYLDIATFYNHYHDLFDQEITGAPYLEDDPAPVHFLLPAQFGNGLLGTTKGFEIAPDITLTPFWHLRASYSFLQMDIKDAPHSINVEPLSAINGASPKSEGTLLSALDFAKKFSLNLTYRYVAGLPGQLVPGYSTADARFDWHVSRPVEVSVVGHNLFQPYHPEYAGDPGPLVGIVRNGFVQLTWTP